MADQEHGPLPPEDSGKSTEYDQGLRDGFKLRGKFEDDESFGEGWRRGLEEGEKRGWYNAGYQKGWDEGFNVGWDSHIEHLQEVSDDATE